MNNDLIEFTKDNDRNWSEVKRLREIPITELIEEVQVDSREVAFKRGVQALQVILNNLHDAGVRFRMTDPGHGPGHLARDAANAVSLLSKIEADPRHIFIGLMAGVLHDVGCALVDRYADKTRAVRHAEVGAMVVNHVLGLNHSAIKLSEAERQLVCYAIAAHTHYLKSTEVTRADGQVRTIEPYVDLDKDGKPFYFVWFPRWIDRLDCVGPSFIARHYLTLVKPHADFAGDKGFVDTSFEKDMTPKFQEECGQRTMLDHLRMFANSQTNDSPYGKWDYGWMIELRDHAKKRTNEVVLAVRDLDKREQTFGSSEAVSADWRIILMEAISAEWHRFLAEKIEPTGKGAAVADELQIMFENLPLETQKAWCVGFRTVMSQYKEWKNEMLIEDVMPQLHALSPLGLIIPRMGKTIELML